MRLLFNVVRHPLPPSHSPSQLCRSLYPPSQLHPRFLIAIPDSWSSIRTYLPHIMPASDLAFRALQVPGTSAEEILVPMMHDLAHAKVRERKEKTGGS